ncbi:hypothetical protein KMC60_gp38 [Achromobacter phage vB_AxyP_19-32_Axy11]|uniref:Uncharacterized protein n=2 Tax=Pourcelvirus TaxID=2842976 RepID=A0A514CUA9_9CAUD|nr:hypothetical protein KMC59_gp40 [Achromobacter phage vB_AxyP_19-32_Axy10]YP_010079448.1 hypothetical protein KMC60_gp38 [Achromobacter phage vB_AxyP_19-32_Axy11]QDH83969.1 hypothetical protein Axy10_078 [Achromobacter phage vB_AxyP_19-32_Axy10]QDH84050.1 hypothetical protein Axy11_077 [Achromobacter phage vB_AxyP_19-32_Axy11]
MRVFYQLDGTKAWNESTLEKFAPFAGDFVICHSQDIYHEIVGLYLILGTAQPTVIFPNELNIEVKKGDQNFILYTKKPLGVDYPERSTRVSISLGKDWIE